VKPSVEVLATLKAVVGRAGQLVSDSWANVTAPDGKGNAISGHDLLACYLAVMKLTPELRPFDVHFSHSDR
jgi:hypothetical protein